MKHRKQRGQGMVEYALILVLVAVVAIVILGLVGWSVQGVTGLVVGAVQGSGANASSGSSLVIVSARCQPGVKIELELALGPGVSLNELTLRNDAPDWYWEFGTVPTSNPVVSLIPGLSCPRSVVVQHQESGAIAAAGVQQVVF